MKDITPTSQLPNDKIFIKKNKVYKRLRKGKLCAPCWLDAYRQIYKQNRNLVRIYDIVEDGKMIVMEKLDIICNLEELFK